MRIVVDVRMELHIKYRMVMHSVEDSVGRARCYRPKNAFGESVRTLFVMFEPKQTSNERKVPLENWPVPVSPLSPCLSL